MRKEKPELRKVLGWFVESFFSSLQSVIAAFLQYLKIGCSLKLAMGWSLEKRSIKFQISRMALRVDLSISNISSKYGKICLKGCELVMHVSSPGRVLQSSHKMHLGRSFLEEQNWWVVGRYVCSSPLSGIWPFGIYCYQLGGHDHHF